MAEVTEAIRVLVLPLDGPAALVPTALVAEVTAYGTPELLRGGPDWLTGFIHWRGLRVPLLSLERALGRRGALERVGRQRSLVVLYALAREPDLPYYAVATAAPPHPTMAHEAQLSHRGRGGEPYGWGRVELDEGEVVEIPDLEGLEGALVEVLRTLGATGP